MKPGNPALRSTRLLDQMRERIRYLHYRLSTEKIYLYWVKFFILWLGRDSAMRHPRYMGAPEIEAFLTMLATERKVSTSTHNQALSALLFFYRQVLGIDLPWMDDINRPANKRRIPGVSTLDEGAGVLAQMEGETALLARLLYGTGMRLMEGVRLGVKEVPKAIATRHEKSRGAGGHSKAGVGPHVKAFVCHTPLAVGHQYSRCPSTAGAQ